MSTFAQVQNGIVTQVIVAEREFIDSGAVGEPNEWVETSPNAKGGVSYGANGEPDGGIALRKNYASVGYTYDAQQDAFIPPQPFPSWLLDTSSCLWVAPTPAPNDGKNYNWDENTLSWVEVSQ